MKKFICTIFIVSLLAFLAREAKAQYDCSVKNPIGKGYYIQNVSSNACDNWFNSNKSDGGFKCSGECKIEKKDKTSKYQAEIEINEIRLNIDKAKKVIIYMKYLNRKRDADKSAKKSFKSNPDIKSIYEELEDGDISSAREIASTLTPDGTVLTIDIITNIISYIDSI